MASPLLGLKYDSIDDLQQSVEEFVRVINVNEERVINAVRNFVDAGRAACECDECILDLLAISLNRTPPRYIVNDIHMNCFGEPAGTPPDDELAIIVENAAKLVAEKPHH